jgi:hypothetical protein
VLLGENWVSRLVSPTAEARQDGTRKSSLTTFGSKIVNNFPANRQVKAVAWVGKVKIFQICWIRLMASLGAQKRRRSLH